jgi:hypothetical protein
MRRVLYSDVTAAARALLTVPDGARAGVCERMLVRAHYADCYTRRMGRPHPLWGNGTLLAVAWAGRMPREPCFDSDDYCRCIALVVQQIAACRTQHL